MHEEFIYNMRGAHPLKRNYTGCIYMPAGNYYKDFDFGEVLNCEKKLILVHMPIKKKKGWQVGFDYSFKLGAKGSFTYTREAHDLSIYSLLVLFKLSGTKVLINKG